MNIINKLISLFSKKKYRKPDININLEINRYGQLIQWRDKPEIVNGIYMKHHNRVGMHISECVEFTIVKNQFKGL